MARIIAERRLRCAFFCGLVSAVAIGVAGCSPEVSRFNENPNRNPYAVRAPTNQPAPVPMQPTRTVAVESQPLAQAQPIGSAYSPQYAALQYDPPQYAPPQHSPAPQYVPPQPMPPPGATPYAPPAPQYPPLPPEPGYGPAASRYAPLPPEPGYGPAASRYAPPPPEPGYGPAASRYAPPPPEPGYGPAASRYPPSPPEPGYAPAASQYAPPPPEPGYGPAASRYAPPPSVSVYAPPAPGPAPDFTGAHAAAPRMPMSAAIPQTPSAPAPAIPTSTSVVGSSAQTLLPTPPVYTVGSGDTLSSVARKYRVNITELAVANGITPETPLKVGTRLTIPVRIGTRSSAPAGRPQPGAPMVAQTKPGQQTYTPAAAPGRLASETSANVRLASPVETPSGEAPNGAPAFRWPARGRVINNFGARVNGAPNDGIDLALPEGTPVRSAEDGVVAYAGNELKGYGNLVLVRHANGFVSAYANASDLMVKRNDQVHKGQVILKSGQTGNAATPQLHFEIRKNSAPVDPMQYLPADKTASAPL
jgi:murein DD-endopeptidase MepM/ murein hydrolase activator NlpD